MSLLGRFVAEFDEPRLTFSISNPLKPGRSMVVNGIIDTGASRLCIPLSLANSLALKLVGKMPTQTASGMVSSGLFLADIHFSQLGFSEIVEVISPETGNSEAPILIGMSVLRQFNIWYHGGMGTWSFYRRE
jgi:predicted aspartyl protease